jgi:hypothetical protein
MIAKQKIHKGNNFMGAFDYNDKKLNHQDPKQGATLLEHNFLSYERQAVSKENFILQQLRPTLTRDAYHVSLNFATEDKLNKVKLLDITKEYMKGMGFEDNLYSIWQHHDADHLHVHLLCSRIRFDGRVVSDSNNYKRSEALCRQLEIKYELQRVRSSKEATERAPSKDEIEMIQRTGKLSNRMLMQEKIKKAIAESSTVSDLINNCKKQGVYLLFNQSKNTGRVSGITYLIDGGFIARGQALGNMFKWKNVTEKIDYEQSRDLKTISESNSGTRSRFATVLERHSPENAKGEPSLNSTSRNTEPSIGYNSGYDGKDGDNGYPADDPREASGLGNGNPKISKDTGVDLLHTLHPFGSSLYSTIGASNDSEIDDDLKKRKKTGRR